MFKTFLLMAAFFPADGEVQVHVITELSGASTCNRYAEDLNDILTDDYEVFCSKQESPLFHI